MRVEVFTTDQILGLPDDSRHKLRMELEKLIRNAFPRVSEDGLFDRTRDYLTSPGRSFQRYAIFLRNESGILIGATVFDYGDIEYHGISFKGIYILGYVIAAEYQGIGLGQSMAGKIFTDWEPSLLLVTCGQSTSLNSLLRLVEKGSITGYDVYPYLAPEDGRPVTVSSHLSDFLISAFEQLLLQVVEGNRERVKKAIENLTVDMIRKNLYKEKDRYEYDPWKKDGREDKLANALGITDKDGILLMFLKTKVPMHLMQNHSSGFDHH